MSLRHSRVFEHRNLFGPVLNAVLSFSMGLRQSLRYMMMDTRRRVDEERAWSGDSGVDEGGDDERAWSDVTEGILSMVLSRLAIGDYHAFQSVCKSWKSITPIFCPLLSSPHDADSYETPHLMYLNPKTCMFNFHDPSRNANYSLKIPQLLNDETGEVEFHHASFGWLLLGRGGKSYFFFNPSTGVQIDLPDTLEIAFEWMCFSGSPTSTNCTIMGIFSYHKDYMTRIGILRLGEDSWTVEADVRNNIEFIASNCSPVVCNGNYYILGINGNLGKLCIKSEGMDWSIIGKSHKQQFMQSRDQFLLESDGNLICVMTLSDGRVRVLKLDPKMVWQKVEDLNGKALYVSHRTSLSRDAMRGTRNKIYFPRFYDHKGLFYCLATKKWRNFLHSFSCRNYYNTSAIVRSIWIELPNVTSLSN